MNLFDLAYGIGLGAAAPYWLLKPSARRKVFEAFRTRMAHEPGRATSHPAVMIHAVSVGELNATPILVQLLEQARPELRYIISATTNTGFERANELYGKHSKATVIRYPLDFSSAIRRMLDGQRPSAVVLMELEVWPNLMKACAHQEIPVILLNGRVTPGSYRNYRLGTFITTAMFRRLAFVCAQDQTYADRFISLGVPPDRVRVTGTMKFDTAQITDKVAGADQLAAETGLRPGQEKIWVCGSTGPGEEPIVLEAYAELLKADPRLRLVIVPRKPERFDEVAELIQSRGYALIRRSQARGNAAPKKSEGNPIILGDTMGELRKFYNLADVVFVGRTLVDLGEKQHGSDMIEPAALAKPVVVGPFTHNFAEAMNRFREAGAMKEIAASEQTPAAQVLREAIHELLAAPFEAAAMGTAAREVVKKNQGATARGVEAILSYLVAPVSASRGS
ncbi:MAG TPA: 3-deoxy-D-manno-octulosonic acid transferase [Humisphaera sp.]|nr:3-deoxy-D-manno-octulosonic acid transferase [Humisphaera sp.]